MNELFKKCLEETQNAYKFVEGQKEDFVRELANQCNRKGIKIEKTKIAIKKSYNFDDNIVTKIIQNEYQNKKDFGIDEKQSIEEFLNEKYDFKYHEVLGNVEYKSKNKTSYQLMTDYKLNSICRELVLAGHKISSESKLYKLLSSEFVPFFNPFKDYFNSLPKWDGKDYILEFSKMVKTDDTEFWQDALKRWMVAMVGCSLFDEIINQTVIVFNGGQGIGKSKFIDRILPPELNMYKYSGLINPSSKDSLILLTENILIDLDELGSLNRKDEKAMKEIITKSSIKLRKPYGKVNEFLPRRASFMGSVNDSEFLMDMTGSRRFLCFEVTEIDYQSEINYKGIYSQALHLFNNKFKFWFDREEVAFINERNEKFRMKDPIEEVILAKYKPCTKEEATIFLSSTEILQELKKEHSINFDTTSNVMIGKVLSKNKFPKMKKAGVQKYAVQKLN